MKPRTTLLTPGDRDNLLMALGLIRGAIEDVPAGTLANASMRVAADLIQRVYDGTRPTGFACDPDESGGLAENVVPFPADDNFSRKVI